MVAEQNPYRRMNKRPSPVIGHIIAFIDHSEYRRLLMVVGTPTGFAVLVWQQNRLGTAAVILAVCLAAFLYTRPAAQQTIAASAYGTGVVLISLVLLGVYLIWSTASTAAWVDNTIRWRAVTGALLLGLGLWLRQIEA
jgi:heme/copper-type cytochrome/quinol oxidase subunit 4